MAYDHEGSAASEDYRRSGGGGGGGGAAGKRTLTQGLVQRAAGSAGSPLPEGVQAKFESSLGADLSGVRVHTGGESADAAKSIGAQAYAHGNDIHFAAGKYQPDDPYGMHLLAHEGQSFQVTAAHLADVHVGHSARERGGADRLERARGAHAFRERRTGRERG